MTSTSSGVVTLIMTYSLLDNFLKVTPFEKLHVKMPPVDKKAPKTM